MLYQYYWGDGFLTPTTECSRKVDAGNICRQECFHNMLKRRNMLFGGGGRLSCICADSAGEETQGVEAE